MQHSLVKLSPGFGIEVRGVNFRQLSAHKADLFRALFAEHHLVLVRDAGLSEDEGVALTETIGPVAIGSHEFTSAAARAAGAPEVNVRKFSFVGNQHPDANLRDGELLFHSDHTFFKRPLKAISLYSLAAVARGGETMFVDVGEAYRRLPEPVKARIANLHARHMVSYTAFSGKERPRYRPGDNCAVATHPLVLAHPESGEMLLFASRLLTESIIGLDYDEGESLLQTLFGYIEDEAHRYVHKWEVGDFLVWDNRQLQHARRDFNSEEKRALRRVPIDDLMPTSV